MLCMLVPGWGLGSDHCSLFSFLFLQLSLFPSPWLLLPRLPFLSSARSKGLFSAPNEECLEAKFLHISGETERYWVSMGVHTGCANVHCMVLTNLIRFGSSKHPAFTSVALPMNTSKKVQAGRSISIAMYEW